MSSHSRKPDGARCDAFREDLPEGLLAAQGLSRPEPSEELAASDGEHLADCAPCRAWIDGMRARLRMVVDLERTEAPRELDGRVVAALEAGHRQTRAAEAVRLLSRSVPPNELERAVELSRGLEAVQEDLGRHRAPSILDRLVEEELADPVQARAHRHLGGLEQMRAPDELDARVEASLRPSDADGPVGARTARTRPRARVLGFLGSLAAALLVWWILPGTGNEPRERELSFSVRRLEAGAQLDPMARGLIDAVSGGMLSARGKL